VDIFSGGNLGGTFTCLGMHGWCCVVEVHSIAFADVADLLDLVGRCVDTLFNYLGLTCHSTPYLT